MLSSVALYLILLRHALSLNLKLTFLGSADSQKAPVILLSVITLLSAGYTQDQTICGC